MFMTKKQPVPNVAFAMPGFKQPCPTSAALLIARHAGDGNGAAKQFRIRFAKRAIAGPHLRQKRQRHAEQAPPSRYSTRAC